MWLKGKLPGTNYTLHHLILGHSLVIITYLFWKKNIKKHTNKKIVKIITVFPKP